MHITDTPDYDALIFALLGAGQGSRQLDARFWCAIEGHQFGKMDGIWLEFTRLSDNMVITVATTGLMHFTTDERHAFAALPEDVAATIWRRPRIGLLHGQRRAECRINSGADPLGFYEARGADTVPLAICAALLAYRRREHRKRKAT